LPSSDRVHVRDEPESILDRIVFYDIDSRPLDRQLTEEERRLHLREIRKDVSYFGRTYRRAHVTVDIAGMRPNDVARKLAAIVSVRRKHA